MRSDCELSMVLSPMLCPASDPLPPSAQAAHLAYLVRQHQVGAELVGSKVDALPPSAPASTNLSASMIISSSGLSESSQRPGIAASPSKSGLSLPPAQPPNLKDCSRPHLWHGACRAAVARRQVRRSHRTCTHLHISVLCCGACVDAAHLLVQVPKGETGTWLSLGWGHPTPALKSTRHALV